MAVTPPPRRLAWLVPALLLVAVVVAVLVVVRDPADRSADDAAPVTPSATTSAAPPADPDTWCAAFRTFAEAQALAVGTPDDPAAQQALRDAADALLGLGTPLGLSEGGQASMAELVGGAVGESPGTGGTGVTPDPEARDAYLAASCPA